MNKKRNSEVDLLRCILMIFVVIIHVMAHGLKIGNLATGTYVETKYTPVMIVMLGFSVVAVDAFFMISGYFHSRFKLRKLIEYVLMGAIYAMLMYLISRIILGQPIIIRSVAQRLLQGFHAYWFLNVWLIIFIFADYINIFFNELSDAELKKFVVVYTIVNLYFGFVVDCNSYGSAFSVVAMFYCYTLGYTARRFKLEIQRFKNNEFGLLYIIGSVLSCCICFGLLKYGKQELAHRVITDYRSPLIVISALGIFLFFLNKIKIKNDKLEEAIVKWGGQTFAVYLITDAIDVWDIIFQPIVYLTKKNMNLVIFVCGIIVYVLLLFIVSICVDFIRKYMYNLIERKIIDFWEHRNE